LAVFIDAEGCETPGPEGAVRALVTYYDAKGRWVMESVEDLTSSAAVTSADL
jgi:hypothetical protein